MTGPANPATQYVNQLADNLLADTASAPNPFFGTNEPGNPAYQQLIEGVMGEPVTGLNGALAGLVSAKMAAVATGTVIAFVGGSVSPTSFWSLYEVQPILLNTGVNLINGQQSTGRASSTPHGGCYWHFRHRVFPMLGEPKVAMIRFCGMMVGIEADGYVHS